MGWERRVGRRVDGAIRRPRRVGRRRSRFWGLLEKAKRPVR